MIKTDIESFREFIHKHPELVKEVKKSNRPWKEVYQDWIVLGEDHESWNQYTKPKSKMDRKKEPTKSEMTLGDILSSFSTIQISDVQKYLSQFSNVMEGVQELLKQFNNQSDRPNQQPEHQLNKYPSYKD